jgi:ATP-dependent DNA helicase RecG
MKPSLPITELNRVGSALEKRLARLGIRTVQDLLHYFPFRYEDFRQVSSISTLVEGVDTTVRGTIELIANKRSPRKRTMITEAILSDGTEQMRVVWFGQPFIAKTLHVGDQVYMSGKVKNDMFGLQMVSPTYEKTSPVSTVEQDTVHTARIVPLYPLTAGITQKQIRMLIKQVVPLAKDVEDWIPEDIRDRVDIMGQGEALEQIHFPEDAESLQFAEKRLKFDELFLLQLRAEMMRQQVQRETAPMIVFAEKEIQSFVEHLPFQLTKAQKIASWEILQDLQKPKPMNRLLEGDVGSGKTVVAGMVTLDAVLAGFQVAIMAPTEILAKQHFSSFQRLLSERSIVLLTGGNVECRMLNVESSSKKKQREEVVQYIQNGDADIVIGTHALLTGDVVFKNLGLVIVDEQHRFGVDQRKTVREKSGDTATMPHFLSMTATPIPRSFALTLYGDLDLSIINEMPVGRKPVQTRVVDPHSREKAYAFVREQVKQGRQVFVICPLIQEKSEGTGRDLSVLSGSSERKSVLAEYKKLSQVIFPDLRIAYLHGKMRSAEKDETMKKFSTGEIDILVSTSVVEVGVDIPNASVMMIEGAENFGLAQLHQFRGRVGRSEHQSYCFLFTESEQVKK